jgi:putative ABC transport system permease protein
MQCYYCLRETQRKEIHSFLNCQKSVLTLDSHLLLTSFGIRDSIQNVTDYQYEEIVLYDAKVSFHKSMNKSNRDSFLDSHKDTIDSASFLSEKNANIVVGENIKSVNLTCAQSEDVYEYMRLQSNDKTILYPKGNEIILSRGLADKFRLKTRDSVTLTGGNFKRITVTITGIFDNYIGDYVFATETIMTQLYDSIPINAAYIDFVSGGDPKESASEVLSDRMVSYVDLNDNTRDTIEKSFASLNLVVLLIILCAGILAFIVLFNLININIGERMREIATIKVLGFYSAETAAYVFREINLLVLIGTLFGLVFGVILHSFVMGEIRPDGICFDSRISWSSYLFGFLITMAFSEMVKLVMRYKLKKINMNESLKSVE